MRQCPQCHAMNAESAAFCPSCGYHLSAIEPQTAQQPAIVPLQPQTPTYAPTYPPAPGAPYAGYNPPPSVPLQQGYQGAPSQQAYQAPPSMPLNPATGTYPSLGGMGTKASQSQTLTDVFGEDVMPTAAQPSTRLQQSLMRNVSPQYAVNRWFMGALGAVVAAVIGLILTFLTQSSIFSAISAAIDAAAGSSSSASFASGIIKSALTPSLLATFALEHHIAFAVTAGGSAQGTSLSGDGTVSMPLTGLAFIPALSLVIGGYLSAASDFQRIGKFSVARGALIAPFYAVILATLAYLAGSSTQANVLGVGLSSSVTPVIWQAFLYGLLGGAVFGGLGGWIQYAGRGFLSQAIPTMQLRFGSSLGSARIVGAISGALVSTFASLAACGALLAALLSFGLVYLALLPPSTGLNPSVSTINGTGTSTGVGTGLAAASLVLILVLTPTLAVYLLALATGTTISFSEVNSVSGSASVNSSFGFFTGDHQLMAGAHWLYVLALIPLICFFAGGRVAARASGAQTPGDRIISGALMAIPTSILFALMAYLAGISADFSVLGQSLSASLSPSIGGIFLTTLLVGALVGAIGGVTTAAMPSVSGALRLLALPFLPLSGWLNVRLDHFTRQPQNAERSVAQARLYDAALATVGFGLVAAILDVINLTAAAITPFRTLIMADAIVAALLVFIPVVLLTAALATAFAAPVSSAAPVGWGAGSMPPLPAEQFGSEQRFAPTYPTYPPYATSPGASVSVPLQQNLPSGWPQAAWPTTESPTMPPSDQSVAQWGTVGAPATYTPLASAPRSPEQQTAAAEQALRGESVQDHTGGQNNQDSTPPRE